ncbi:MAG: hypothetical protein ACLP8A_07740, partial [Methylovirgula sp.]
EHVASSASARKRVMNKGKKDSAQYKSMLPNRSRRLWHDRENERKAILRCTQTRTSLAHDQISGQIRVARRCSLSIRRVQKRKFIRYSIFLNETLLEKREPAARCTAMKSLTRRKAAPAA